MAMSRIHSHIPSHRQVNARGFFEDAGKGFYTSLQCFGKNAFQGRRLRIEYNADPKIPLRIGNVVCQICIHCYAESEKGGETGERRDSAEA